MNVKFVVYARREKNVAIPAWLATTAEFTQLPTAAVRYHRPDYLEKTLGDIQRAMAEDMYQATMDAQKGFLQQLNPVAKLAGVAFFILSVLLAKSIPFLVVAHGLIVLLALVSGIKLKAFLLRTWLPVALFSGIVLVPGMFSFVTPGESLVTIYHGASVHLGGLALPSEMSITRQGVAAAAYVMLRSAASLGLVVLLVKTTRWAILTKAMGRLGIPCVVVMVLDLTYRYLFLFLLLLTDFLLGKRSRLVGVERSKAKLVWIGSVMAGFLGLCGEYSKGVTAAMLARGYSGENLQSIDSRFGLVDACFLVGAVLSLAIVVGGEWIGYIPGI
jgi:cobalt/nickel transport system permease protein